MGIKVLAILALAIIFLLSGCQSLEEKELQCNRCYTSTCTDQTFCNSTNEFMFHLHKDLFRHTEQPCPEEITTWKNPKYSESCHTKGSYCGQRTFKVTALNGLTTTGATPTAATKVQEGTTAFPILKPPQSSHIHEYTFTMYSCTVPEKDCVKSGYPNSKPSAIFNPADNTTAEFEAEFTSELRECGKCQRDFCNKAPIEQHEEAVVPPPTITNATPKFDASIVNVVILFFSFMAIHLCCEAMV